MIKLLKYELLRRKQMLIGAAITAVFAEGLTLLGIYLKGGWSGLAIAMTVLVVVGGLVLTFLDAVTRLYSDFKQKHGYMIFMTPNSGYRIIWAKTIFALLEILAAGIVIAGCLLISASAADRVYGGEISRFIARFNIGAGTIAGFCILGLLEIMAQLSIAMLAVTVSRVMTQGSSYNWLVALAMYFALAVIVNMVNGALLLAFGAVGDIMRVDNGMPFIDSGLFAKYLIIGAATYSAWFAGCTLLSGRLINRGIDI